VAKTGSGKTLAFLLPIFHLMAKRAASGSSKASSGGAPSPAALVLAPTRELALQIHAECVRYGGPAGADAVAVYGGAPMFEQKTALTKAQSRVGAKGAIGLVVVATPGRLCDLMKQGSLRLTQCYHMVLDEADRMLDMVGRFPTLTPPDPQLKGAWYPGGFNPCTYQVKTRFQNEPFKWVNLHRYAMGFEPQLKEIFGELPPAKTSLDDDAGRQTLMFTATWPKAMRKMAAQFLAKAPEGAGGGGEGEAKEGEESVGAAVKIFLGEGGEGDGAELSANKATSQRFVLATDDEKDKHLYNILTELKEGSRVIAFANTKRRVEMLSKVFWDHGFGTCAVHGDKPQKDREAGPLYRQPLNAVDP
jgi:superfamily II DNA/RNA helicase